jgi:tRNA dimethylallyltransferase
MLSNKTKKRNLYGRIPVLVGPTGVGKSEIAYHLALRLKAEILSADAFQIYRGMEVGTAQPPLSWRKKVPHHLISERSPEEPWNAVEFAQKARKIIDEKVSRGIKLIIVGGAGFYLKTLVEGAPSGAAPRPRTRHWVEERTVGMSSEKTHSWLQERDPETAKHIHPNDVKRLCRALEKTYDRVSPLESFEPLDNNNVLFLGLERSRENLKLLLRNRAEKMWNGGLINETKELLTRDIPSTHSIWGAIGYAEALGFLKGVITKEAALERISQRSRQYAKRQWTWFRHQHDVYWMNLDLFPDNTTAVSEVEKWLLSKTRKKK